MMSTTAPQPATTPIPVQLSESEFTTFILPHLSLPKRGPKCKLGYYRVLNLILWLLYTGMQWKCVLVPTDPTGKPAIHYTTIYKVFAKWADDGSLWQAFLASVRHLAAEKQLALLLDSRVVDVPMSYNPIVVTRSFLKSFFFNGLQYGGALLGPWWSIRPWNPIRA